MKKFIKWMDATPRWLKIVFALPFIDIIWGVYRILGAIAKKDWVRLALAIAWVLWAAFLGWVLDLIWIIWKNHIFWFQD